MVAPDQVVTEAHEIARHGWVVEIYAARSPDEIAVLESMRARLADLGVRQGS